MTFKHSFVTALITALLGTTAHASMHELWPQFEGFNEGNDAIIEACLKKERNAKTCETLDLPFDGANWSAGAHQSGAAWAAAGNKFYVIALKRHPEQEDVIRKSQLAWNAYAETECAMERDLATYDDDDSKGQSPPFYDRVTYESCIYGLVRARVIKLSQYK